jgi:hypothetical protein
MAALPAAELKIRVARRSHLPLSLGWKRLAPLGHLRAYHLSRSPVFEARVTKPPQ